MAIHGFNRKERNYETQIAICRQENYILTDTKQLDLHAYGQRDTRRTIKLYERKNHT